MQHGRCKYYNAFNQFGLAKDDGQNGQRDACIKSCTTDVKKNLYNKLESTKMIAVASPHRVCSLSLKFNKLRYYLFPGQ